MRLYSCSFLRVARTVDPPSSLSSMFQLSFLRLFLSPGSSTATSTACFRSLLLAPVAHTVLTMPYSLCITSLSVVRRPPAHESLPARPAFQVVAVLVRRKQSTDGCQGVLPFTAI